MIPSLGCLLWGLDPLILGQKLCNCPVYGSLTHRYGSWIYLIYTPSNHIIVVYSLHLSLYKTFFFFFFFLVFRSLSSILVLLSSVQSLIHVRFFATPCTAAHQASLSITNSQSLLKLMSIASVMPSNHLVSPHNERVMLFLYFLCIMKKICKITSWLLLV